MVKTRKADVGASLAKKRKVEADGEKMEPSNSKQTSNAGLNADQNVETSVSKAENKKQKEVTASSNKKKVPVKAKKVEKVVKASVKEGATLLNMEVGGGADSGSSDGEISITTSDSDSDQGESNESQPGASTNNNATRRSVSRKLKSPVESSDDAEDLDYDKEGLDQQLDKEAVQSNVDEEWYSQSDDEEDEKALLRKIKALRKKKKEARHSGKKNKLIKGGRGTTLEMVEDFCSENGLVLSKLGQGTPCRPKAKRSGSVSKHINFNQQIHSSSEVTIYDNAVNKDDWYSLRHSDEHPQLIERSYNNTNKFSTSSVEPVNTSNESMSDQVNKSLSERFIAECHISKD